MTKSKSAQNIYTRLPEGFSWLLLSNNTRFSQSLHMCLILDFTPYPVTSPSPSSRRLCPLHLTSLLSPLSCSITLPRHLPPLHPTSSHPCHVAPVLPPHHRQVTTPPSLPPAFQSSPFLSHPHEVLRSAYNEAEARCSHEVEALRCRFAYEGTPNSAPLLAMIVVLVEVPFLRGGSLGWYGGMGVCGVD